MQKFSCNTNRINESANQQQMYLSKVMAFIKKKTNLTYLHWEEPKFEQAEVRNNEMQTKVYEMRLNVQ